MQGSVAVSPNPIIMDSMNFRQNFGMSFARSVLQRSCGSNSFGGTTTARCLFGPPETKQCKDLVREVELRNSLNFGKRFNFDVVNGEPFPSAKKMKLCHADSNDSDEENIQRVVETEDLENVEKVEVKKEEENEKEKGYVWTEKYTSDYMAMCNKHAINTSIVGPSRHTVSLLFAPIIPSSKPVSQSFFLSSLKSSSEESPKTAIVSAKSSSSNSSPDSRLSAPTSETNNNNIINKNKNKGVLEKRQNRINSHHQSHSCAKKSLSTAQQILTRVKHAVMKKSRKSTTITDHFRVQRGSSRKCP